MVSDHTRDVIARAKAIYAEHLRDDLEAEHRDRFVSIEPESGDHFLGDSFEDAVHAARSQHPTRLCHTIRIGHRAAFTIGLMER